LINIPDGLSRTVFPGNCFAKKEILEHNCNGAPCGRSIQGLNNSCADFVQPVSATFLDFVKASFMPVLDSFFLHSRLPHQLFLSANSSPPGSVDFHPHASADVLSKELRSNKNIESK